MRDGVQRIVGGEQRLHVRPQPERLVRRRHPVISCTVVLVKMRSLMKPFSLGQLAVEVAAVLET
jgi:hypothetical protein